MRSLIMPVSLGLVLLQTVTPATLTAEEVFQAEDMVVTVGRTARDSLGIPAHVAVISRDDLYNGAYLNIAAALRDQAGIHVRSISGTPATAELSMRGFGESSHGRVLVLVDGRPLNRPDMAGINWLQIPLSSVEKIEIIHGAHSALHGNHAVGGVINIISRPVEETTAGTLEAEIGTAGYHAQRVRGSINADFFNISAYADRMEADGFRQRSAYDALAAGLAFACTPFADINLTGNFDWSQTDYQLPGGLTREQIKEKRRQAVNQEDEGSDSYWSAHLMLGAQPRENHSVDLALTYGRKELESDFASFMSYSDLTVDTWQIAPRYTWDYRLAGMDQRMIAGIDVVFDKLDLERYTAKTRGASLSGSAAIERDIIGGYLRNETFLTEKMLLGLGARRETARYSADVYSDGIQTLKDDHRHNTDALAASLLYLLDQRSKLFARAESVYRYPFTDEQISYYGFGDSFYKQLSPEKGWNTEAGGDVEMTAAVRTGVTLFLHEMKDEIAFNAATFENENMDRTRRYGMEARIAWQVAANCRLRANYTYTDAEVIRGDDKGNTIPLVPEQKVSFNGLLQLPHNISVYAVATYVGSSYIGGDTANQAEKLEDYIVVDVAARYRPAGVTGLELFAAVDNLFNEKYNTTGFTGWSGEALYPAAGITARGGVRYSF